MRKILLWLAEREIVKWAMEVNKMNFNGSWQPKMFAVLGLITALANAAKALMDNDPSTNVDIPMIMSQVAVCVGLFTARQDNKSSEQVGAGVIVPSVPPTK